MGRHSDDSLSVLYLTQYFPPETGAAANRVDELTRRWADSGHDVTVVTSVPDYPEGEVYDGYHNRWYHIEERNGVTVAMTRTLPASNAGFLRRGVKFLWFMIASFVLGLWVSSDIDVTIATSPQPLTGVSAALVSTFRRVPFVFEVRDLWPESIVAASDVQGGLTVFTIRLIVGAIYRTADRIVVVSQAFEDEITSTGVPSERIWYQPNGVDLSFSDDSETAIPCPPELRDTVDGSFVVSYVGTIGRAHGLSVVLDAAQKFEDDDVLFLLVGYGARLDDLRERAREEELDNVVFTGRKPKEMVPSILAQSDVSLVHLKSSDLFELVIPSKIFESMAAGLPIALGAKGEARRIVEEASAGLVFDPEDAGGLAQIVRTLYDDQESRKRLGENGRQYVTETFDWDEIADSYAHQLVTLTER